MPKQNDTRQRINRSAIELIAARGVDSVSMRDIARSVGVSEAALYRYFQNREALVWEVFRGHYEALARELKAEADACDGIDGKLEAMVVACAKLFDTDRDRFVFILLAQHIQKIAPSDYVAGVPALIEDILRDAVHRGEIPRQDTRLATAMLMGAVLQSALYCLYSKPQPLNLTPMALTIADACRQVIRISRR